jgi:hypothetical protein
MAMITITAACTSRRRQLRLPAINTESKATAKFAVAFFCIALKSGMDSTPELEPLNEYRH